MVYKQLILLVFLVGAPTAHAALLGAGTFHTVYGSATRSFVSDPTQLVANVSGFLTGPSGGVILANQDFSPAGANFTTSFTNGATFNSLVTLLTNGQNNYFSWNINFPAGFGGISTSENQSTVFAKSASVNEAGSFVGDSIDRIDFSIINLSTSPGTNPNRNGQWVDFIFDLKMNVYGISVVPEPNTTILILIGLTGIALVNKRRLRISA